MANKFVPWIDKVEPGTTTQEQSVFAKDSQRVNGFVAGDPASAIRVNSALRQANVVVTALMQLADELKTLPDLDLNSSVANIANALKASIITPIKTHLSNLDDEVAALSGGSSTLGQRVSALESEMNAIDVSNKLDKNLGAGLAGQYLVVGDNGDIITTDTIDDVANKLDKNLGARLAGQYLVVGNNGDIITTGIINGGGGGNIGSYWAMIPSSSIPTYYGDAYISFSFTANDGYNKELVYGAELKDILLASSVNIYRTQTDYAYEHPEMNLGELYSHIYNGDGTADGKQIIKGKATLADGSNTSYDCLLFVCEDAGGGDEKLELGIIDGDGHMHTTNDIRLDGTASYFVAVFYLGGTYQR